MHRNCCRRLSLFLSCAGRGFQCNEWWWWWHLDGAATVSAAVPASLVDAITTVGSGLTLSGPKKANQSRGEEQDGAQESEGDGGLVLAALVAVDRVDVVPVEYVAAAATDKLE